jgi:hypothetical protein
VEREAAGRRRRLTLITGGGVRTIKDDITINTKYGHEFHYSRCYACFMAVSFCLASKKRVHSTSSIASDGVVGFSILSDMFQ